MIPGVTAIGVYGISVLPEEYDLADPDSLQELLRSPFDQRIYLLEAQPWNPDTAAAVTVRKANLDFATSPSDTPASAFYEGCLITPYNVEATVFSGGRLAARSIPAYGEVRSANTGGNLDAWAGYSWAERDLVIKAGTTTFRYDQFGTIFAGTAEGVTWDWNTTSLRLRDNQYKLAKPIQTNRYGGHGAAVRGDGVDDALLGTVTCPSGSMTLEAVVRPTTVANADRYVVAFNNVAPGDRAIRFATGANNRLRFVARNDAGTAIVLDVNGQMTVAKERYHVALVLATGDAELRAYVDGEPVGTAATTGTFLTTHTVFGALRAPNSAVQYLDGEVDEIRVWNVARTAAQIKADYNRALLGTETGLTYYNPLNEQTGTTAAPVTGTGTLTLTGATWVGSLEGDATIAGKPKPLAYGQVREVEPVPVDVLNLIYQWNDGSVLASDILKDAGVALTGAGDVSDLYGTTVTSGQYKTDNARGYLRLGALPVGTLHLQGRGDNSGSGYVSTAPDIIRRIVTTRGGLTDPDDLDVATFTAANTANSAVHNYATRLEQRDIDAAVDELAASIGAFWTYDIRLGVLRLIVFSEPGTPVATLSETTGFARDTVEGLTLPPPAKLVRILYKRHWTTQAGDALATSVSASDRLQYAEEYRSVVAPAVMEDYLDAEELEQATLMDTVADAQAEAERRLGLYSVRRQLVRCQLVAGLFTYQLGDTLAFAADVSRYDLANWKGRIVRLVEDVGDGTNPGTITVELWG